VSARGKKSIVWKNFAPRFWENAYLALFELTHSTQKEDGAVVTQTVSIVQRVSHLWIPGRQTTAQSAVIVCLLRLRPPLSEVFSDFRGSF